MDLDKSFYIRFPEMFHEEIKQRYFHSKDPTPKSVVKRNQKSDYSDNKANRPAIIEKKKKK